MFGTCCAWALPFTPDINIVVAASKENSAVLSMVISPVIIHIHLGWLDVLAPRCLPRIECPTRLMSSACAKLRRAGWRPALPLRQCSALVDASGLGRPASVKENVIK
jgi:hypothetical protein